ncbi:hypothetical protein [Flindersiella endophytica]
MQSISVHVDALPNRGRPCATNTSTNPLNVAPRSFRVNVEPGSVSYTFEPYSYTALRFGAAR